MRCALLLLVVLLAVSADAPRLRSRGEGGVSPPAAPAAGRCEGIACLAPNAQNAVPADESADEANDPLGANAACYVCHMTFVKEELAKLHLKEKIGCIECHGRSEKHANDENVGATKPDVTFKRQDVDRSCAKCHDSHDAPATKVISWFVERRLPSRPAPICTDCHGAHKIEGSAATKKPP